MSKQILKCTCPICGESHELEADYLVPGIEGFMNLNRGRVSILDSTKTDRHCKMCASFILENAVKTSIHVEVVDE